MADDNVVFVGSKEVMNYVLAVTTQFNEGSNEGHSPKKRGMTFEC